MPMKFWGNASSLHKKQPRRYFFVFMLSDNDRVSSNLVDSISTIMIIDKTKRGNICLNSYEEGGTAI